MRTDIPLQIYDSLNNIYITVTPMQIQTGQEQFKMTEGCVRRAAETNCLNPGDHDTWFRVSMTTLAHYILDEDPTVLAKRLEAMGYKQDILRTEP